MYKGERFNSISHLIGMALALIGLVLLVVSAARQGDPWKVVSFSIYGTTLLLLYTFGVVFYAFDKKPHFHGIWHLFVLAGSLSHYFTVLFYVL